MTQFFVKTVNGKTHTVNVNNNTTASGVINKLRRNGKNVDTLVLKGKVVNGNKLMRNTGFQKMGLGVAIKRVARGANNRGANARGARPNARGANANARRGQNRNVNRVRSLLSREYIQKLKNLKNQGLNNEEIKQIAIDNLRNMINTYLISALNKM